MGLKCRICEAYVSNKEDFSHEDDDVGLVEWKIEFLGVVCKLCHARTLLEYHTKFLLKFNFHLNLPQLHHLQNLTINSKESFKSIKKKISIHKKTKIFAWLAKFLIKTHENFMLIADKSIPTYFQKLEWLRL